MPHHEDGKERVIPQLNWRGAGILMLVFVVLATTGWEINWRSRSYDPTYVNSYGLWAIQRREVSRQGDAVVIIGSSRAFFDINLDLFEEGYGRRPIQLALEGTSPRPFLEDLANDSSFSGTVLVGVTPGLFYSGYTYRGRALDYHRNETPSEWMGQQLSMLLEERLGFIESVNLPLFKLLEHIPMENRKGVYPPHMDVHRLAVHERDRNTKMWRRVVEDPTYKELARAVWAYEMPEDEDEEKEERPPIDPDPIFEEVSGHVDRIRSRGGDVVFIRCPSEGIFRDSERERFPKEKYWDSLLVEVDAGGIHFEDNAALQGLELPEWSHLSPEDARIFTRELVPLVGKALTTRAAVKDEMIDDGQME
jgi:hypothetical protein